VFVSDTYVLTHALALDGRSSAEVSTTEGQRLTAEVAAYEPVTGLVMLRTETSGGRPAALASQPPEAGTLAVAVGRWQGRDVAVPLFITSVEGDRYVVGAVSGFVTPGMPVYNLDGELLALAADDGREGHAFPIREAATRLIARAATGERLASFGIALQDLAGLLSRAFAEKGALICDVVPGGPATVAGIRPGDVLLAVGDVDVDTVDAASRALGSVQVATATMLRVLRNGRVRLVEVTPALAYEVAALARATNRPSGPEARTLFPGPLLDQAGIPATARVLSVNGRAVSSRAQTDRELQRSRQPVVLSLVHDNRRFFAAVERTP
jgi:S1-C subfamily serine protease